jgi:hypothetical protein
VVLVALDGAKPVRLEDASKVWAWSPGGAHLALGTISGSVMFVTPRGRLECETESPGLSYNLARVVYAYGAMTEPGQPPSYSLRIRRLADGTEIQLRAPAPRRDNGGHE